MAGQMETSQGDGGRLSGDNPPNMQQDPDVLPPVPPYHRVVALSGVKWVHWSNLGLSKSFTRLLAICSFVSEMRGKHLFIIPGGF